MHGDSHLPKAVSLLFLVIGLVSLMVTTPGVGYASGDSASARMQLRVCNRVEKRFSRNEKMKARINVRLMKRFGFNCDFFSNSSSTDIESSQDRDIQRRRDVNTILNAIGQYTIDGDGRFPFDIAVGQTMDICSEKAFRCVDSVSLSSELVGRYMTRIPDDPLQRGSNITGYQLKKCDEYGFAVIAPLAETSVIKVQRRSGMNWVEEC